MMTMEKEQPPICKRIALVAHDNCKADLVDWVKRHARLLTRHHLTCTGTSGKLILDALRAEEGEKALSCHVELLKSGPLGGDLQMGALIAENRIDLLIFFWDPMQAQPHDVDVKALLRISNLYNIPTACNVATADFLVTSPLFKAPAPAATYDFDQYVNRSLNTPDRVSPCSFSPLATPKSSGA